MELPAACTAKQRCDADSTQPRLCPQAQSTHCLQHEKANSFVVSIQGSYHLHLMSAIAMLYNHLHMSEHGLPSLPELCVADSGELFGLVKLEHSTTFSCLFKEEPIESVITLPTGIYDSDDGDIAK